MAKRMMKPNWTWCLACAGLLGLGIGGPGCGRESAAPQALPVEQAPQTLESVFARAPAEAKALADQVVQFMNNGDDPNAFAQLQALCARTDLSADQRQVATQVMLTVSERLQAAAEAGNQAAGDAIQLHRSAK
jgi:hypothetical protein